MKKFYAVLLLLGIVSALSYGCATQDYVKQQIEPLSRRISKLEAELEHAKKEGARTRTMAQEAAKSAERAEAAAKKASKAFELQPKQ